MNDKIQASLLKVPEVTLMFWLVKIAATTLGETGGDAVSMSMGIGYAGSSVIFLILFCLIATLQIKSSKFNQYTYWLTVITTTTVGTTLADLADRTLGLGYTGGVTLLVSLLIASLYFWYRTTGTIAIYSIKTPSAEAFYWLTIMFSQTLGTALGDWTADSVGIGYTGSMFIFGSLLGLLALAFFFTSVSRTLLFWSAFILTRPLGAVVGDFIDKPLSAGGLELSRFSASLSLIAFITACLIIFPQHSAKDKQ